MRTVRQWAASTGIPYRTLLAAVKRGDLAAYQFVENGQILIAEEEMTRFLGVARTRAKEAGTPCPV